MFGIRLNTQHTLDLASDSNYDYLTITGDFNEDQHKCTNSKIKDIVDIYNLKQVINESTHFTENSASLLDLVLFVFFDINMSNTLGL